MSDRPDRLKELWECGYSVAELWGLSRPVQRATSAIDEPHGLLWGILSIAEQQVSKGMGHRYMRQRLHEGDWLAIGYLAPRSETSELCYVPRIEDAQFGRRESAIGDDRIKYVDIRIVHAQLVEELSHNRNDESTQ